LPVRETSIQLLDVSGNQIVEGFTDTEGNYALVFPANGPVKLRVKAVTKSPVVKILDNTSLNAIYALDSEVFTPDGKPFDMNAGCGWEGSNTAGSYTKSRSAAPFAILDTLYTEERAFLASRPSIIFDDLNVYWSPKNDSADGAKESGHIGTSHYSRNDSDNGIYVLGKADSDTDEFDDHVIAHEWGHYFEDKQSRGDSIGGSHGYSNLLDARLAFGEGWANALSGIVLSDQYYLDTTGIRQQTAGYYMNLETDPDTPAGFFSETSVQQILYDIWDNHDEGSETDGVHVDLGIIYDVMHGPQKTTSALTTIYSFLAALKAKVIADDWSKIDTLAKARFITCVDEWGTNQLFDVQPSQTQTTLDQLIYINGNGTSPFNVKFVGLSEASNNKLVQNRYVRIKGTGSIVSVKASRSSSDSSSTSIPIRMIVYQSGQFVAWSDPDDALPKTMTFPSELNLDYVLTLQDRSKTGSLETIALEITK
jgi:hypothetical protein